jgi:MFS transporter, SP family, sugar:H+ symporter
VMFVFENDADLRLISEVKVARHSVGWQPTTTFREIRASVAAQGGLGPSGVAKHEDHEKVAQGVEYRGEEES